MKNFLHLYRFGEWLSEQGFNVIHPIKQADASWMQMLGIASSKELNIMMEHYYHFQAPIKAYSPRDVIKKLQDGISAYGLRINSKLDVNSKRTAESEKTIDVSWYDMYRHKHLWYKNVLDIGDAFYTFPPSLAQGASQAIESANEIFELIKNNNTKMQNEYFKDRVERINLINKRSKLNYFSFHLSNPFFSVVP